MENVKTRSFKTTVPIGIGFVTEADQTELNLSFDIIVQDDSGIAFVAVTGTPENIQKWVLRNKEENNINIMDDDQGEQQ